VLFFAWRTWHYTGVFSVLYGTSRDHLSIWAPGMPLTTLFARTLGSVMMVLTLNDPAQYDPYAAPVVGGAIVAVLSVAGVPRLRRLPLPLVLLFFSTIVGAFVARGSAYSGRFSLHVIPVTCALSVSAIAALTVSVRRASRDTRQPPPASLDASQRDRALAPARTAAPGSGPTYSS
jgi:hypothetical protein